MASASKSPALDHVIIGGDKSPGKVEVRGFATNINWDERKGYGNSGATLVPAGAGLARGSLVFFLWDDAQFPAWYAFAAKWFSKDVVFSPGSASPRALSIFHPQLAAPPLSLSHFVVEAAGQLEQDEYGLWTAEIKLVEYRRPKPAPPAPNGTIPAAAVPQPTAEDAADRQIEELTKQFNQLTRG